MRPIAAVLLATTILLAPSPGVAGGVDREDAVEPFTRDVYVVVNGALQNPNGATDSAEPLYNVAGAGLEVTWGEWQAATGASKAIQIGGPNRPSTDVKLDLEGLIPSGVYSVFYGTFGPDSENPLCPDVERTLALPSIFGKQQPDRYSFVADPFGFGSFHGRVEGSLLEAQQVFLSVIWHADGRTYGELPNRGESFTQGPDCRSSYGDDAMRHLAVLQKWS